MFGLGKAKVEVNPPTPGDISWPFRLGDRVRDKINGLEGVAIERLYYLSGCDRFAIEPDAVDNKPADHFMCDANRIELVTAHPDRHREERPSGDVNLGDKVEDVISGLEGTATVILIPLHGATRYSVEPPYNKTKREQPQGYLVDEHLLRVVKPLHPPAPAPALKDEPAAPPRAKPPGPMRLGVTKTAKALR